MVSPAESCKRSGSCRLLGDEDTLSATSSASQVCRGKELPACRDTRGNCDGHSAMLGFGRQGMQPRNGFVSGDAGRRRIKQCDCQTLVSKRV